MRFLLNWRKKEYEQSIRIGKTLYRYSLNSFCWLNIVLNYLKIRLLVSSMKYVNVIHCFQSVQEDMVVYLGHNFFWKHVRTTWFLYKYIRRFIFLSLLWRVLLMLQQNHSQFILSVFKWRLCIYLLQKSYDQNDKDDFILGNRIGIVFHVFGSSCLSESSSKWWRLTEKQRNLV